jgi:beta-N-acetylhexosaminidase
MRGGFLHVGKVHERAVPAMIQAMSESKSIILGVAGTTLSPDEIAFFRDERPWGFILFARNIADTAQVLDLVGAMRDCVGRPDAPVFIDQEGGRVQRFRKPLAPDYPPASALGALYAHDRDAGLRAAWLMSRLHAFDLLKHGVNADCLPVLDVPVEGAHDVIGNRAYGKNPAVVSAMGRAAMDGLVAGGVLPVIKHIPGHGRAFADSHHNLPVVDASVEELSAHDFPPFAALADAPMAMTAHVVYTALDADRPATTSPTIVADIIRGELGFDGLLMSDDVSMKALSGDFGARTDAILAAGCDVVLHCNGVMDEMRAVAARTFALEGEALRRADRALEGLGARTTPTRRRSARNSQACSRQWHRTVDWATPASRDRRRRSPSRSSGPTMTRAAGFPSPRLSSMSPASRVRSTCCCIWRAIRRSIWRRSRSSRLSSSTSPSSITRGRCAWSLPPTISSWPRGWRSSSPSF